VSDHIPDVTKMISDTPISDSTPHNVGDLGMLCRRLERELNAANSIIRQQQLLDEENLRLKERIKRLDETLEGVTDKLDGAWGIYMKFKEAKL
jgi:predicted Ser/Thr protein kinase